MRMLTPYLSTRGLASDLWDEMDRLLYNAYDERTVNPACEIAESDDHILMSVDLPGMKKEDIKIEVAESTLTVSGERRRESPPGKMSRVQRYEKSYGFFKRAFTLPSTVDASKVEARYENGVLEVCLPKADAAKPRQVEIRTDKGGLFSKFLKGGKTELKEVGESRAQ